jgi:repressor LexA
MQDLNELNQPSQGGIRAEMTGTRKVLLTEKQKRFYDALRELTAKSGASPTVAELVRRLEFSSPRAVTQYLEALERKGLIERRRYEHRGIRLVGAGGIRDVGATTVEVPVIASAGCDNVSVFAERSFGDYICVATELLQGIKKDNVVCVKAVGDSMVDAGVHSGDYVLVEVTEAVNENDLVVAIVDSFAVIKKLELANNAVILRPVSSDPQYKPIILNKNFQIFGRVIDVIRTQPKGEIQIIPLHRGPEAEEMHYDFV